MIIARLLQSLGLGFSFLGGWACLLALSQFNHFILPAGEVRNTGYLMLGLIGATIGAAFLWLGRYTWRLGKQKRLKLNEALLLADKRPPVLYLRSFKEDGTTDLLSGTMGQANFFARIFFRLQSTEEQLAALFEGTGPLICIGDPRETLPELGAHRFYFRTRDDAWREEALRMLDEAQLVLLRAGTTAGLAWELEQAWQRCAPHKIAILFLERKGADFTLFEQLIRDTTGADLPPLKQIKSWWRAPKYGRLITFSAEKALQITEITVPGPRYFFRSNPGMPLELALYQAFLPHAKANSIALKHPAINWFMAGSVLIILALLLVFLIQQLG
jgi:hypothetical protein